MDLSIFFAGTAGSVPTPRRGLPAILLRAGGERILFDCGEGTQAQLLRSIGLPEVDAIFISHLHIDHWLGLPGMIKTFDMRDRDRKLEVFGPPGLGGLFKQVLRPIIGRTGYPLDVVELEHHEEVGFDDFVIAAFPVNHRVEAYGFAFIEDDRPGRFDVEAARRLGVTEGPDFGRLQRGETVNGVTPEQVVGEDRVGRRIVYTGDTAPVQSVEVYSHKADVLIHEATFCEDERGRARETGHSTARQAATTARDAGVKLLALTHLSTRYFPREIREEAKAVFENTVVPRDFDTIEVPFPERGEPHLVKTELVEASS
jgi:ribonuclease Z